MFRPSISSGGSITINQDHYFSSEQDREDYFNLHPTEKVEGTYIVVIDELQKLINDVWVDQSVVVRGPQGEVGPAGTYTAGDGIDIVNDTVSVDFLDESGHIDIDVLPSSIVGAVQYRDAFDPASGAPTPAAQGYYYVASGIGEIDGTSFSTGGLS